MVCVWEKESERKGVTERGEPTSKRMTMSERDNVCVV